MKFQARASTGLECLADKYHRCVLDGEPQNIAFRFDKRVIPRALTKKFGKFRDTLNCEPAPASLNLDEAYYEAPGNSNVMGGFMNLVSKPVAIKSKPSRSTKESTQAPLTAREGSYPRVGSKLTSTYMSGITGGYGSVPNTAGGAKRTAAPLSAR